MYYEMIAQSFEVKNEQLLRPLNDIESAQLHKDLVNIVREAGNLAARLSSQNTKFGYCHDIGLEQTFSVSSDFIEAHATMRLDEHSHDLDGQLVICTVQPSIWHGVTRPERIMTREGV